MRHYIFLALFFMSSLTYSLCAQNSKNELEESLVFDWLVSNADELPIEKGDFIALPGLGLFMEDRATFYSVDSVRCPDIVKFRMKAKLDFEQTVISQGNYLVKCHELVARIHDSETSIVAELDTENFILHAGTGSKYHLEILEGDGKWGWYTCDWTNGEITCNLRTSKPISHIFDNGKIVLCVMEDQLYAIIDNKLQSLAKMPDYILDGVITMNGLFLCTKNMLYYYNGSASPASILQGNFHSLHYDGKIFYVVLQDGRILKTEI